MQLILDSQEQQNIEYSGLVDSLSAESSKNKKNLMQTKAIKRTFTGQAFWPTNDEQEQKQSKCDK